MVECQTVEEERFFSFFYYCICFCKYNWLKFKVHAPMCQDVSNSNVFCQRSQTFIFPFLFELLSQILIWPFETDGQRIFCLFFLCDDINNDDNNRCFGVIKL